jgi:lysophospholipase L1-like esterase
VRASIASLLLLVAALWFGLGAALAGPSGLGWIAPFDEPLRPDVLVAARASRGWLIALAAGFGALAVLTRRKPLAPRAAARLATLLLPVSVLLAPLTAAELTLRPLLGQKSLLFMPDEALGWRLIPGATGLWGGVPVRINAKGLRGPELPYPKPTGTTRILFLGDSVTFGYRVAYEDTIVHHVEQELRELGHPVEAINAGVGGYSPWQELAYLEGEGLRYQPDLVVLSFVLNDVTTKFGLPRFGGSRVAFQLRQAGGPWLASQSGVFFTLHHLRGRAAVGRDVSQGAADAQLLDVESLVRRPEDPRVDEAWQITLANVREIVRLCREREIGIMLVAFPYRFQLREPDANDPQRRLAAFAAEEGLLYIDMLERLIKVGEQERSDPWHYFVDYDHLSPLGARVASRLIVDAIGRWHPALAARAAD